ncbi:MAG TPA: acetylornithine/succinylornithine family transaminase [Opitutales bacterium]|nr:acetylornithine/succinylornithine family transaminase [Opitutales bacterium]
MIAENPEELYEKFVLGNYPKAPLTLVEGNGVYVRDDTGKEYLDFSGGIGVNSIGHAHPFWVQQIAQQAATLAHTSNLYRNELQGRVAGILVEKAGPGKVFFCNSGLEANEALFKLARRHGLKKTGEEGKCFKIISARKSFHGRSFSGMAATDQERVNSGFAPLLPGFVHADFNDLASFEAQIDEHSAAIVLETIQGEGGIHPATPEFIQGIRELCNKHDLLLLLDEVQCGIGRTGDFFAFEESGITPDAIGMAKGLGGGFPIGAMWVRDKHTDLLPPSSHGTTFGGSALACAAALATLTVIERENLLENVSENGPYWMELLKKLEDDFSELILSVRGRGYMIGVQLAVEPPSILEMMRSMGLIGISAGGNVIRFLPALTTGRPEIEKSVRIFRTALAGS